MSLGPTFVQDTDNNWYENPSIRGEINGKRFFVCWDDDEPIELVFEDGLNAQQVINHLKGQGWLVEPYGRTSGLHERIWKDHQWFHARAMFVKQVDSGPTPQLLEGNRCDGAAYPERAYCLYFNGKNGHRG